MEYKIHNIKSQNTFYDAFTSSKIKIRFTLLPANEKFVIGSLCLVILNGSTIL